MPDLGHLLGFVLGPVPAAQPKAPSQSGDWPDLNDPLQALNFICLKTPAPVHDLDQWQAAFTTLRKMLSQPAPSPTPGEVEEVLSQLEADCADEDGCDFCECGPGKHHPNCHFSRLRAALSRGGGQWTRDVPDDGEWVWVGSWQTQEPGYMLTWWQQPVRRLEAINKATIKDRYWFCPLADTPTPPAAEPREGG